MIDSHGFYSQLFLRQDVQVVVLRIIEYASWLGRVRLLSVPGKLYVYAEKDVCYIALPLPSVYLWRRYKGANGDFSRGDVPIPCLQCFALVFLSF